MLYTSEPTSSHPACSFIKSLLVFSCSFCGQRMLSGRSKQVALIFLQSRGVRWGGMVWKQDQSRRKELSLWLRQVIYDPTMDHFKFTLKEKINGRLNNLTQIYFLKYSGRRQGGPRLVW